MSAPARNDPPRESGRCASAPITIGIPRSRMSASMRGPGFISGSALFMPLVLSSIATPVFAMRSSARLMCGSIRE